MGFWVSGGELDGSENPNLSNQTIALKMNKACKRYPVTFNRSSELLVLS
jgi:hypothetical protein